MYGAGATGGGSALAMTGLATGSWILFAVGLVFAGVAVIALVKRHSSNRP
jgi:LPXTG-motif cell wall-anchored protein